jgi:hypothetical protein
LLKFSSIFSLWAVFNSVHFKYCNMKKIYLIALIIFSTTTLLGQTKIFKGAWFEVKYPSSFTAKSSLKSSTSSEGCESALFESPDHLVEFYIFSPQWSGNPTDISLKSTEKLSGTSTQTSGTQILKWWKISAKDGSYTRSYYEKRDTLLNTNLVFGIKYKNQHSYNKYKKQYLAFKSSLIQYAD